MLVNHASGYIEENNGNKYLISDNSVNENKLLVKKYADVWDGIKNEIKPMVAKKIILEKITWRLYLILTMTCHQTNH